jgi:hypothetical protein
MREILFLLATPTKSRERRSHQLFKIKTKDRQTKNNRTLDALEPKIQIKSKAKVESPKHQAPKRQATITKLISESTRPGSDR